ncbi:MAG: 1,4-alpha-glucan branching protein domain-containing protein [Leptospiraceae bacterium]|nr:1,4-alpha-glucan branching protein domain-containing protein [Leptospiraceae bacterium]
MNHLLGKIGYQILVLHAHLPYVRHEGYFPPMIEENWLNEAICETYLPLLRSFREMRSTGTNFKITMSFTPPLISMLKDPYLQNNFLKYIEKLIELSEKEKTRTTFDAHLNYLSSYYHERFVETKKLFLELDKDITNGFLEFYQEGNLEIITCTATHGFLPYLESEPSSVRAQISIGRKKHRETWGQDPRGIWLAECGYFKNAEKYLADEGFRYFFVDSHSIINSVPRPKFGVYAPIEIGNGLFAFGRDQKSSSQVWSAKEGYPGDYRYREYYRDIGFDLDYDYIKDYIHPTGIRYNTGIKYHRITGKTAYKEYYQPDWAKEASGLHAEDFLKSRIAQSRQFFEEEGRPAVIVSPYDAELYGHGWYEGPMFLEFLFKKMHFDQNEIISIHPMQALGLIPKIQSVQMEMSSWGEGGYGDVWLNASNEWIYKHILECSISMNELAHKFYNTSNEIEVRILQQMARELLLLQSSDWPFIMKTGTVVGYAVRRIKVHTNLFLELKEMILSKKFDIERIDEIEKEHPIYDSIDYKIFC